MTRPVQTKQDVLDVLRAHESELRAMGIEHLDLFGSFARDEAGPQSDVDLLATFEAGAAMAASSYFARQYAIEDLLGRQIDLVGAPLSNPYFAREIHRDAVSVI